MPIRFSAFAVLIVLAMPAAAQTATAAPDASQSPDRVSPIRLQFDVVGVPQRQEPKPEKAARTAPQVPAEPPFTRGGEQTAEAMLAGLDRANGVVAKLAAKWPACRFRITAVTQSPRGDGTREEPPTISDPAFARASIALRVLVEGEAGCLGRRSE